MRKDEIGLGGVDEKHFHGVWSFVHFRVSRLIEGHWQERLFPCNYTQEGRPH